MKARKAVTVQPPLQAADFCRVLHKMSERFSLSKTLKNGSAVMCWHLTCCTLHAYVCVCVSECSHVCPLVCVFTSVCVPPMLQSSRTEWLAARCSPSSVNTSLFFSSQSFHMCNIKLSVHSNKATQQNDAWSLKACMWFFKIF